MRQHAGGSKDTVEQLRSSCEQGSKKGYSAIAHKEVKSKPGEVFRGLWKKEF